jgi:hypothetical protein
LDLSVYVVTSADVAGGKVKGKQIRISKSVPNASLFMVMRPLLAPVMLI